MNLEPFWSAGNAAPSFPRLEADITADVVVVGAGITGLTAAYRLASAGRTVVVIDKSSPGMGDTVCTSAHLSAVLDTRYSELASIHGRTAAKLAARGHMAAIDAIESTAARENIDCRFKRLDGYLCAGKKQDEPLDREVKAMREAGLEAFLVDKTPEAGLAGPAIRVARQARFHPILYLNGLLRVLPKKGVKIFSETAMAEQRNEGIATDSGKVIKAGQTVIATHSPVEGSFIFLKQTAFRTYVTAARVAKGWVADALYWDTEDPYHYVRIEPFDAKNDLLIVGGEDHRTGEPLKDPEAPFRKLEDWLSRVFRGTPEILYRWSGQVLETADGLAYIGRIPYRHGKLYMATGYSGNGLTYGTLAGTMIADQVLGKKDPWKGLYDPTRKNLHSVKHFIEEGANSARQMSRRVWDAGAVRSARDLKPGEGGVLNAGVKKEAVYRDEGGELHRCSAVCPHLGCVVQWNSTERTFDCPCHGSRFSPTGEVLNGPALRGLEPKKQRTYR